MNPDRVVTPIFVIVFDDTSLGIKGANKWKLKATIYSRKAVLGWGASP